MKAPWEDFKNVRSQSFIRDLIHAAQDISPDDLIDMSAVDAPIRVCLAYAQDELAYNKNGDIVTNPNATREEKVNKFGLAYRRDAKLWLHKTLAKIICAAAEHLYEAQGWTTVIYDGLRTVNGAFKLYTLASDSMIASGLLALPGQSAHNKALAVDSMMVDEHGKEIDMGGHFDHLDMSTNSRTYDGDKISNAAKKNRLIREAAFLRGALSQGLLIAPLRPEFWDDRLPENRVDLWRVLDSATRVMGITLQGERKEMERWNYADFLESWQKIFRGQEKKLEELLGITMPPSAEKLEFYHGNYHPLYDESLRMSGKHLTE